MSDEHKHKPVSEEEQMRSVLENLNDWPCTIPGTQLTDWEADARGVLEDNPDPIKVGHRWMQRALRAAGEIRRLIAELRRVREDHEHVCVQRDAALSANRQLRDQIASLIQENERLCEQLVDADAEVERLRGANYDGNYDIGEEEE